MQAIDPEIRCSLCAGIDVSDDGSLIVGRGLPGFIPPGAFNEAFRWTAETSMLALGFLTSSGGGRSQALATSADGSVVVGSSTSDLANREQEAFL